MAKDDQYDNDLHPAKVKKEADENYTKTDLKPGGAGKVGDQQQFGEDREGRKDKSQSSGDSDKMHGA
jgi:hypothetical protein